MKIKEMSISIAILICMAFVSAATVFAATWESNVVISLPENQVWTSNYASARAYHNTYCVAKLISVYPLSGRDSFTKIQTRVLDDDGDNIMQDNVEYVILTEGKGYKNISLKQNHVNDAKVYFQFRGNSASAATAVVDYSGY